MNRRPREGPTKFQWMGYNVSHNLTGMVHNAPLASAPGKELHPAILSILEIHGGQVKREREIDR